MKISSEQASSLFKLAVEKQQNGDSLSAVEIYKRLLSAFPNRPSVLTNLSAIYIQQRNFPELNKLIDPLAETNRPKALLNVGTSFFMQNNFVEACIYFKRAFDADTTDTEVIRSLAYCLVKLQQPQEAALYAHRLAEITNQGTDWGRACHYYSQACDWASEQKLSARKTSYPFYTMTRSIDESENLDAAQSFLKEAQINIYPESTNLKRRANSKLKIGYVCGEFREHATLKLLISVFEHHNYTKFDVVCFDNGARDKSEYRKRLEATNAEIIKISHLSDSDCFNLIREQNVDVLFNLNGFFGNERNSIFFGRAARIQISYLGYPGTIGHPSLDFLIADKIVLPKRNQPHFSEKIVYLDPCYQPNDHLRPIPLRKSQKDFALPPDKFIFCCLNNTQKITSEMFKCWMEILDTTDNSILLLLEDNKDAVANLQATARVYGQESRLYFSPRLPTETYVSLLACTDLFLDTFPCNAHTTATDALWAGLPILTMKGQTFASRVSASLIRRAELSDDIFIASSFNEYVRKAKYLRENECLLRDAKDLLNDKVQRGGFVDMKNYTEQLESIIERLHRTNS